MRVVSLSDARQDLDRLIDQVVADAAVTVIHQRGGPDAVLMSLDTYNSIMETAYLLGSPANAAHLAEAVADYRSGNVLRRPLAED